MNDFQFDQNAKELAIRALTYIDQLYEDQPGLALVKKSSPKIVKEAPSQASFLAPKEIKAAANAEPKKEKVIEDVKIEAPRLLARQAPTAAKTTFKTPLDSLSDMQAILKKLAPEKCSLAPIPSDYVAKKVKESWKNQLFYAEVIVLSGKESSHVFLEHVAKAIESHFRPCKMIKINQLEQEKSAKALLESSCLKMLIASDQDLWSSQELMGFYHEIPQKKERYLGKKPLLLIPDTSLYFKDPSLKRSLWNLLCQVMKSL